MRKLTLASLALAALLGAGQMVQAQVPGVPGAPGVPVGPAAAGQAAGQAGGANNIFSMFKMTQEQKDACREKICRSGIGQMLNGVIGPASAATGGVIPPLCPPALPSDLLKPADSAEGAAARIAADEAAAKERRKAVKYLGTVDCRYWPEATEALVNALRADRNECVRLEAALSLGRGCCCNKATIRALTLTVNCSDEDGNPIEASPRVRAAAEAALVHCLECYSEKGKLEPLPPTLPAPREELPVSPKEDPTGPKKEGEKDKQEKKEGGATAAARGKPAPKAKAKEEEELTPALYYKRVSKMKWHEVILPARKALEKAASRPVAQAPNGRNISAIVARSMGTPTQPLTSQPPVVVQQQVVRRPAPATGLLTSLFRSNTPTTTTQPRVVHTPVTVSQPLRVTPMPATMVTAPKVETAPVSHVQQTEPRKVYSTASPVPQPVNVTVPVVPVAPVAPPAPAAPPLSPTERTLPTLPGTTSTSYATPAQTATPVATTVPTTPAPVATALAVTTPDAQSPVVRTTYAPTQPARLMPVRTQAPQTTVSADVLLAAFNQSADLQRREWIVRQMGRLPNGGNDHRVVSLLIQSAELDPSALVRIASLESIQSLRVSHGRLPEVLTKLKRDHDVRVRMAAVEASNTLR